jgi:hypothetical protein
LLKYKVEEKMVRDITTQMPDDYTLGQEVISTYTTSSSSSLGEHQNETTATTPNHAKKNIITSSHKQRRPPANALSSFFHKNQIDNNNSPNSLLTMSSEMKALVDAVEAVSRKREHAEVAESRRGMEEAPAKKRGRKSTKANLPREERLALSRFVASESRRRKREMVEDLERSIAFFTMTNAEMKATNAELEREILLAKQRVFAAEKGLAVAPQSNPGRLLSLLQGSPSVEDEQAQAAHFAATQALYKSMGFPPAAARQAASTFAASTFTGKGKTAGLPDTSSAKSSPTLSAPSVNEDRAEAQAAHFAATQALYKTRGFPPRAAKEAAATFSRIHQATTPKIDLMAQFQNKVPSPLVTLPRPESRVSSGGSYVEALQRFAQQQQAAAKAAASMAAAALQAVNIHNQQQRLVMAPPVVAAPSLLTNLQLGGLAGVRDDNAALRDLIAKLCQQQPNNNL